MVVYIYMFVSYTNKEGFWFIQVVSHLSMIPVIHKIPNNICWIEHIEIVVKEIKYLLEIRILG